MITVVGERFEKDIRISIKGIINSIALEKFRKKSEEILADVRRYSDKDIGRFVLDFGGVTKINVETKDWITLLTSFISGMMLSGREVIVEGVDQEACLFLDEAEFGKLICVRPRS